MDDLDYIFKVIFDNVKLLKWVGGFGNDWINIWVMNVYIYGINGKS